MHISFLTLLCIVAISLTTTAKINTRKAQYQDVYTLTELLFGRDVFPRQSCQPGPTCGKEIQIKTDIYLKLIEYAQRMEKHIAVLVKFAPRTTIVLRLAQ